MRVGFIPSLNPDAGGVFQYSASMAAALTAIAARERGIELVALLLDEGFRASAAFEADGWSTARLLPPAEGALRRALSGLLGQVPYASAWRNSRRKSASLTGAATEGASMFTIAHRANVAAWWRAQRFDLMLFPQPHALAFEAGVPFVIAVQDLQHRLQPEFQEVSADGEWARREYIFRNGICRAERVLVDSELGKEHVMFFYEAHGARADRVDVLPFLPGPAAACNVPEERRRAMRARLGVPDQYILYPAAFWSHKNHAIIVEALARLAYTHQLRVHAVFCGSKGDAERERQFRLMMDLAEQGGVTGQIHVPGYVTDDDLAALYTDATALVMPTFFGPTNIPVLEAWAHNCPVLTSDIPGIREQVGDAAILVDPRTVDALADGIRRLVTDGALRLDLAARGARRLATYTPAQYQERLWETLRRASGRPVVASG